jgi:hypothetical protein
MKFLSSKARMYVVYCDNFKSLFEAQILKYLYNILIFHFCSTSAKLVLDGFRAALPYSLEL